MHMPWHGLDALQGTRAKPGNHIVLYITIWTFLRAGKLYITDRRGPSTNVSYFHYRSGLDYCCFVDSTCHQPVMAASSLQELAAMRNLTTCELDKRRQLVTDLRISKRHMASSTCLVTRCRPDVDLFMLTHSLHS